MLSFECMYPELAEGSRVVGTNISCGWKRFSSDLLSSLYFIWTRWHLVEVLQLKDWQLPWGYRSMAYLFHGIAEPLRFRTSADVLL
jgi:hypothetical protein